MQISVEPQTLPGFVLTDVTDQIKSLSLPSASSPAGPEAQSPVRRKHRYRDDFSLKLHSKLSLQTIFT